MTLNAGHVFLLKENTGEEAYAEKKARLFTAPATLDGTEVETDFTWEDDATAGPAVTLQDSDWTTTWVTDHGHAENVLQTMTYTVAASAAVQGAAVLDSSEGTVISATLRPSPVTPGIGDKIEFLPIIDSYNH